MAQSQLLVHHIIHHLRLCTQPDVSSHLLEHVIGKDDIGTQMVLRRERVALATSADVHTSNDIRTTIVKG
jgi:hypothetical protein